MLKLGIGTLPSKKLSRADHLNLPAKFEFSDLFRYRYTKALWAFGSSLIVASLSNDHSDGNENGTKAVGLINETTTLHACITLLCTFLSLPSLYDYDVKMPNFTICEGREQKTTTFFSFSLLLHRTL